MTKLRLRKVNNLLKIITQQVNWQSYTSVIGLYFPRTGGFSPVPLSAGAMLFVLWIDGMMVTRN
jgi:hypothetical protein